MGIKFNLITRYTKTIKWNKSQIVHTVCFVHMIKLYGSAPINVMYHLSFYHHKNSKRFFISINFSIILIPQYLYNHKNVGVGTIKLSDVL